MHPIHRLDELVKNGKPLEKTMILSQFVSTEGAFSHGPEHILLMSRARDQGDEMAQKDVFAKSLTIFHTLDRPTSGVVLFAKTSKALSRLQAMMRNREMHKTYVLLAEGHVSPKMATLEHNLVHDMHRARVDQCTAACIIFTASCLTPKTVST